MVVLALSLSLRQVYREFYQLRTWVVRIDDTTFLVIMFVSAMLLAFAAARALR